MAIIAFDFDGVIAEFDNWKGVDVFGNPIIATVDVMRDLKMEGHKIIIWTTRQVTQRLKGYLNDYGIPYDSINDTSHNPPGTSNKPIYDVLIDDRALFFDKDSVNKVSLLNRIKDTLKLRGDVMKGNDVEEEEEVVFNYTNIPDKETWVPFSNIAPNVTTLFYINIQKDGEVIWKSSRAYRLVTLLRTVTHPTRMKHNFPTLTKKQREKIAAHARDEFQRLREEDQGVHYLGAFGDEAYCTKCGERFSFPQVCGMYNEKV